VVHSVAAARTGLSYSLLEAYLAEAAESPAGASRVVLSHLVRNYRSHPVLLEARRLPPPFCPVHVG
jgi:hypothetical protein